MATETTVKTVPAITAMATETAVGMAPTTPLTRAATAVALGAAAPAHWWQQWRMGSGNTGHKGVAGR